MTEENFLSDKDIKILFKKFIVALLELKSPPEIEKLWEEIKKVRVSLKDIPSHDKTLKELAEIINSMVKFLERGVKFAWILRIHGIAIFIFSLAIIIAIFGTVFYFVGRTNMGMFLIAMCGILLGLAGILISIFSIIKQKFE